jgi:hypothetical protein
MLFRKCGMGMIICCLKLIGIKISLSHSTYRLPLKLPVSGAQNPVSTALTYSVSRQFLNCPYMYAALTILPVHNAAEYDNECWGGEGKNGQAMYKSENDSEWMQGRWTLELTMLAISTVVQTIGVEWMDTRDGLLHARTVPCFKPWLGLRFS